jgi:hypothetical protein
MSAFTCDLNRSTQQSNLFVEKRSVADETETQNTLLRYPEVTHVGPLAERRPHP